MPADKSFAFQQLKRFSSFPGVPGTDEEFLERAVYLSEVSPNNQQCQEIADRLYYKARYFPLPVDIDIAAERNTPRDWEPDNRNPMDRITHDGRFFDELEPELIEKTFQMLNSPRDEVRRFAEQVLNGLVRNGRLTREAVVSWDSLKLVGAGRK